MEKIKISKEYEGLRVDKALTFLLPDKSRNTILKMIEEGYILLNGEKFKPSIKAKEGDELSVEEFEPKNMNVEAEDLNLDIVYQDDDVLVINKPKGMVVHPACGNYTNTLVNGLLYEMDDLPEINGVLRPGIVHRIDKDTTGLLMVAKTEEAMKSLTEQLKTHSCKREYIALVYGTFDEEKGRINVPIARSKLDRKKMAVDKEGKEAITNFEVLKRYKGYTLIKCVLETGRTHQIRVHMEYIDHPLVGDKTYGRRKVIGDQGQFLHAKTIGFTHPRTGKWCEFTSELPQYFKDFLNTLTELQ